jgi:hypothetical protein
MTRFFFNNIIVHIYTYIEKYNIRQEFIVFENIKKYINLVYRKYENL